MENDQVEKSKSDWIRCYRLLEKMSAVRHRSLETEYQCHPPVTVTTNTIILPAKHTHYRPSQQNCPLKAMDFA